MHGSPFLPLQSLRDSSPEGEPTLSVIAARCQLPRRGSFIRADRKMPKSSPFGGAGAGAPERVQPAESLRKPFPQCRAFADSGVANAVPLHDPTCEKGVQESPQTFLNPKIKNNSSLNYAQSEAELISNRYV